MNEFTSVRTSLIKDSEERDRRQVVWECKCDCGKTAYVPSQSLKLGNTKSCGCGQKEY